ncbi:hypothetical protein AADX92_11980, partial [Staphylococcus epidermidis]|uniref:hypothetical protein n=1 Tax=Staphylococcus epidermidis TaxID=1282 RepID=UPI00311F07AB
ITLDTSMLAKLLLVVIVSGMVIAMATNNTRRWWQHNLTWIIHLGIGDMKSHLAGLKATFGALRILTERRSW